MTNKTVSTHIVLVVKITVHARKIQNEPERARNIQNELWGIVRINGSPYHSAVERRERWTEEERKSQLKRMKWLQGSICGARDVVEGAIF